jgi:hypothetical protein
VQRRLAATAASLAAVAIAGGAVWAGFALSSGKTTPEAAAASSTSATASPFSPIAAASSAVAAPSSPVALTSTATPSPPPAVAVCDAADLQFSNPSNAISGAEGETVAIVFRNIGSQPCSLTGWPTIRTPGLHTKVQYSTSTGAGFEVAVTRLVLQPQQTGATALDIFGIPGGDGYGEQCFAAGSWAVTLPGSHQTTSVSWPQYQGACPGGTILVSPFYLGDAVEIGFDSADPSSIPCSDRSTARPWCRERAAGRP